jgi:hypothetical protein
MNELKTVCRWEIYISFSDLFPGSGKFFTQLDSDFKLVTDFNDQV